MALRSDQIVNLLSAVMVLLAGFYVIIFLPLQISNAARIGIGVVLVLYFLFRIVYFLRKLKESQEDSRRVERPQ